MALIDSRLAEANADEARAWLSVRAEIVRQEAYREDLKHLRAIEKWGMVAKFGLSVVAIAAGSGLAVAEAGLPAFLCLGAGLYGLAPNFVDQIVKRLGHGGNKND